MSDVPENTIFGSMTSRPAGKRKIKPTALLFQSIVHDHDSDDEDEDFQIQADPGNSTASEHDSDSESHSDENESESEGEENTANVSEPEAQSKCSSEDDMSKIPICGVCIKPQNQEDKEDFMQCDKCGIYVHESCYGGIFLDENEDESTSTTFWFCEPCLYGLNEPPYCEFCPNRYGAFKRTDIGGRWVHLICALYTNIASFSAVEQLTGISWQEVGNSIFGKKTCSLCKDRIEARLGVTSRCESGLCKDFLHATCAQKYGLLVDESENNDEAQKACVTRYFYCKKHSHNDESKKLQKIYSMWERQECQRITKNRRRKLLLENEERQRVQMFEKLERIFESLTNVTINIPTERIDKSRRTRYLNTSSEFFDKFESKAENAYLTRQEFREQFCDIKTTNLLPIPIGFSKEYIDYMEIRDKNLIPEEEEKLKLTRDLLNKTKLKMKTQSKPVTVDGTFSKNQEEITEKKRIIENFYKALKLIEEKPHELSAFIRKLKIGDVEGKPEKLKRKSAIGVKRKLNEEVIASGIEKICGECEMKNDTHLMCQCDQCEIFYHIGCLNPPLTRLPKRTVNCGWICHECNTSDEEDDETDISFTDTRASRSRRAPVRNSAFIEH